MRLQPPPPSRALGPTRLALLALFSLLAVALGAAPPAAAAATDEAGSPIATGGELEVLDRRPGRGEQCLVCGQPIHGTEVFEVRARGRRFYVADKMMPELESDPDRYLSRIEAHAGLFDERAVVPLPAQPGSAQGGWLWLGTYILAGLLCGAFAAYVAVSRSQPALPWFFAGLAVNLLALVALAFSRRGDASTLPAGVPRGLAKVPITRAPRPCPHCGASVHPAARSCGSCGAELEPLVEAETERA